MASRGASARERAIVASGLSRRRDLGTFLMVLVASVRAQGTGGLRDALEQAKSADRVTVVTVEIDSEPRAGNDDGWWDVPFAKVSSEDSVNAARAEYEHAIRNQLVVW